MNKRTRAIDEETYKLLISAIQKGFEYEGVVHKPNERIATVLQLEYNLGLQGVGTHSFRKAYATNIYVNNHYNIELVRVLLQHSSTVVSQRYIGIGSKELETAIEKNINLCKTE